MQWHQTGQWIVVNDTTTIQVKLDPAVQANIIPKDVLHTFQSATDKFWRVIVKTFGKCEKNVDFTVEVVAVVM